MQRSIYFKIYFNGSLRKRTAGIQRTNKDLCLLVILSRIQVEKCRGNILSVVIDLNVQ